VRIRGFSDSLINFSDRIYAIVGEETPITKLGSMLISLSQRAKLPLRMAYS
jgi:hypothetical protein